MRGEIAEVWLCLGPEHRHCEARSDEAIHSSILLRQPWIASRSLSSGAHSRDPLARNDELKCCLKIVSALSPTQPGSTPVAHLS
jgi:hypothetical protein